MDSPIQTTTVQPSPDKALPRTPGDFQLPRTGTSSSIPNGKGTESPERSKSIHKWGNNNNLSFMKKKKKKVRIAVLGMTGAGKTTFINTASGSDLRIGLGLKSCTDKIQLSSPFELDGYSITLIDTPGFDDTLKTDAEILDIVCEFLLTEYKHEQFLNGVIYLHRISDNRMSGSALRNFRFFEQLCGPDAIKNCAIVTNMWNMVERDIAESREHELFARDDFFKRAIDGGAKKFRHLDNTKESAHSVIKPLLANKPVPLRIQTELSDPKTSIANTTAGAALLGELAELTRKHEEEMRELEADLEEAKRENDLQATRELEEAKAALAKAKQKLEEETKKILASDAPVEQKDKLLKRLVGSGRTALNFVYLGRLRPTKYVQNLNPFKKNGKKANEDRPRDVDHQEPSTPTEHIRRPEPLQTH